MSWFCFHLLRWQRLGVECVESRMGVSILDMYILQLSSADTKQNVDYMDLALREVCLRDKILE